MQQFTIQDYNMPRLDAAILKRYPLLSSGKLHKYLKENKIKTNGKKLPLSTRLPYGSMICIYLPDDVLTAENEPVFLRARKELSVVFEDANLIVADKDAGLPVMDESNRIPDTLINRVLLYLNLRGEYIPEKDPPPRLCHRLDTGTSGLVLIAKNAQTENFITDLIKKRAVSKQYLCVTYGHPSPAEATLHSWLVKDAKKGIVHIYSNPVRSSREIITHYCTSAVSGRLSLLNVDLITGRTHQIRAHLASIGCPILGDSKYGNNAINRELKLKYQALCAYRLQFPEIKDGPYAGLSNKVFIASRPWYYSQITDGTLG